MSKERSSRSWSRTRSADGKEKRRSVDLRRSLDPGRTARRLDDNIYQRFILTDPVAFRYLEDDPCVEVLETRLEIPGYQCYIVEQWATSRSHPTFVIITYTGDSSDKITSATLGIPRDESRWSHRLKIYFKALNHFHARRRDTPDGILMITSLPGFPSSLTVLLVPDGDVSKHYADFFVNEDLKRLGCSGRVGLILAPPNNATIAKYHQVYRTSDKVPLYNSVIELVRMCQTALYLFDLLETDYMDGLLCDVTEKALMEWWATVGSLYYSSEPNDGILGSSTVAALIGLLLGARKRLHTIGIPVPKDPFDLDGFKKGVGVFQRMHKMTKTRRLDKATMRKLHSATQKAATAEGWHLPKAVKTTVAEISGKGDELLAEGQTKKSKSGISDVETMDIDALQQLVFGERSKWLWQGKTPKRTSGATPIDVNFDSITAYQKGPDQQADGERRKTRQSEDISRPSFAQDRRGTGLQGRQSLDEAPGRQRHRDSAARRVQDVLGDGRAGISRLKDAVNPLSRAQDSSDRQQAATQPANGDLRSPVKRPPNVRSFTSPVSSPSSFGTSPPTSARRRDLSPFRTPVDTNIAEVSQDREKSQTRTASMNLQAALQSPQKENTGADEEVNPGEPQIPSSRSTPSLQKIELDDEGRPDGLDQDLPDTLRRTRSASSLIPSGQDESQPEGRIQRRLSLSVAEDSMYASAEPTAPAISLTDDDLNEKYVEQQYYSQALRQLQRVITDLSTTEATWTASQIDVLEELVQQANEDHDRLRDGFGQPAQDAQNLRDMATAVLRDEQEMLGDGKRDLESLAAKLDYEISNLRGKIEDVEQGVDDFARAVEGVEGRMEETEKEMQGGRGWGCVVS